MVMGPTHAMSGALAGLAVAGLLPAEWGAPASPAETFTFAAVCAGAALLPDLDTPQSTVSRSFGPLSRLLARLVDAISLGYYTLTKGKRDGKRRGGHRTLTHTLLFAVALGAGVAYAVSTLGKPAIVTTLFLALGLALRGLGGDLAKEKGWILVSLLAAALAALTWQWYPTQEGSAALGIAVTLGCIVHGLGDAITKEGVPLFAPFVQWNRERWWEIKLPEFLSIRAGGAVEKALLGPALTLGVGVLAIMAVDGAPQAIYDAFTPVR
ncbi:metal-dependent hydrolase [Rhodococcus rhodnii]|uniref:Metal-dependent hydrolase n=2 Tax=Rhodococcus rhodnii TaxID=38312 RepID=R7WQU3_9NOCA|nr:metal-dependent hydrolase [Rhodococcus rhodnii]EOM77696.1 hypothetical protein Rrhod_0937 [Rhodococcus rhodnii LMG 5362]TXG89344.1 metal-dependent hydrolase [Rhodococcus rhodnii]